MDCGRWIFEERGKGLAVCAGPSPVSGYADARAVGDAEPLVAPVLRDIALPSLPIWLTVHEELRTSRLIRRVFDMLIEDLAALR